MPEVKSRQLKDFPLWKKMRKKNVVISFDLELTARCNLDCRHCYINLPAADKGAEAKELTLEEINRIADEAVSMGALWCLITGGEPLLRKDFREVYLTLKKKGLLLSVFTNATLITEKHIELFKEYPPREIEVTVYGVTKKTYEKITGKKGSYEVFKNGLELLLAAGIKVQLKAMALRSNIHELGDIARFCRERTADFFRFDPHLHLRYDRDPVRNRKIEEERLSPEEIAGLERSDPERFEALKENCDIYIVPGLAEVQDTFLFHCGAGIENFTVGHNGYFRLCASLWHPDCMADLRRVSLKETWDDLVPRVRDMKSHNREYLEKCCVCSIANLCLWCPAHAYLEKGELDAFVDYFCQTARCRAESLKKP
jgi:radical SAM protein with 4Fe4S-binding SPASM domain